MRGAKIPSLLENSQLTQRYASPIYTYQERESNFVCTFIRSRIVSITARLRRQFQVLGKVMSLGTVIALQSIELPEPGIATASL